MPTVTLPLQSASASGKIGKQLVFQGTVVRSLGVVNDPQTPAQVAVRDVFRDITKTEKQLGLWAVNALRAVVGSRWYTGLYKRVAEDGFSRLAIAQSVFSGFTTGQQNAWDADSIYQSAQLRPGFAFFAVMYCINDWFVEGNAPGYGLPSLTGGASSAAKTWATQNLDGAFTAGEYDNDHVLLSFSGSWNNVTDASAYGGVYKESAVTGSPSVSFYLYGTQISIGFLKKGSAGSMQVVTFVGGQEVISQQNTPTLYGQRWSSRGLIRALHYVTITRTGTGAINLDSITVGNKKVVTAEYQAMQAVSEVPSVCLTLAAAYSAPGGGGSYLKYALSWDKELWDTVGMHDGPDPLYHIRTLVSGRYDMHCEVAFQNTNETWTGQLFVYVNSVCVAFDTGSLISGVPSALRLEVNQKINLTIGDMLTVYVATSRTVATPINIVANYTPIFSLELSQRTSLLVETLNVTQQVGTNYHSALDGLSGDDHVQYHNNVRGDVRYPLLSAGDPYTQYHNNARGDARYPLLAHTHNYGLLIGAHGFNATVGAGVAAYLALYGSGFLAVGSNFPIPIAATLKNFYIRLPGAQPGTGSLVFTVLKNNVASALVVTIPAGSAGGTYSNTTQTVSVIAGDLLTIQVVNNATGASAAVGAVTFEAQRVTT